jgi:hypothetical protein
MAFIIDPRLNLENAIKYGARAAREKRRIDNQADCSEWDDLCHNYEIYKEEGDNSYARYMRGETIGWTGPVLKFSESEIIKFRDDAYIKRNVDDLQTDEEYIQSYVDKIRSYWISGHTPYSKVCAIGSCITSLIKINSTIPWLDSDEIKAFNLWLYYNIRNTRIPENDVEMLAEVQRIYNSYMPDDVRRRSKMNAMVTESHMFGDIWLG